jgi:RimJ/RimL family protein N-acetyltransferase
MHIRPAREGDGRTLYEWRNDPETRSASVRTDPISWEGHVAWLQRVLVDPNRLLLIGESGGVAIGTVRYDVEDDWAEVSWTVAPGHRGRGLGTALLRSALAFAPRARLVARIKPENLASQRIAAAAGFLLCESDERLQRWVNA